MTTELPNEGPQIVPSDLPGFWRMVVDKFNNTPTTHNIENLALELVKNEGMEAFSDKVRTKRGVRRQLKRFLGNEEWDKVRTLESDRILKVDKNIDNATAG